VADRGLSGVSGLSAVLWSAAVACAAWGLLGSDARPRDTRLLQERYAPDHVGDDAWELQLVDYGNALRPWHPGYGEARRSIWAVSSARRQRVSWPPPER